MELTYDRPAQDS